MNKLYALFISSVLSIATLSAQTVFTSNFTTWDALDSLPTDWDGLKTSLSGDSMIKITNGSQYGGAAVQLINSTNSHRRFTTKAITLDSNTAYKVEMWVKGQADLRTNYYTNAYGSYNSYVSVNDTNWTKIEQVITPSQYSDTAELIISFRNTVVANPFMIDSVALSVSTPPVIDTVNVSVYDIQFTNDILGDSPYLDSLVKTTGVVSAVDTGAGYWIQDGTGPWSGIFVFDNQNTPVVGDQLELVGTVIEYFNLTEITNVSSYSVLSSSNTVAAVALSSAGLLEDESYEGVLVRTPGTCTEDDLLENGLDFGAWTLDNTIVDDNIYLFQPTEGQDYEVTGVVTYSFGEYRLLPRDMNDISFGTSSQGQLAKDVLTVYPNPAQDVLFIESAEQTTLNVFNALGSKVMTQNVKSGQNTLNLTDFAEGLYYFAIQNKDQQIINKVSIVK